MCSGFLGIDNPNGNACAGTIFDYHLRLIGSYGGGGSSAPSYLNKEKNNGSSIN